MPFPLRDEHSEQERDQQEHEHDRDRRGDPSGVITVLLPEFFKDPALKEIGERIQHIGDDKAQEDRTDPVIDDRQRMEEKMQVRQYYIEQNRQTGRDRGVRPRLSFKILEKLHVIPPSLSAR